MMILMICTLHQTVFGRSNREWDSGACSTCRGEEKCIQRPLGRPRSRWDNNIKMDLQEVLWEHKLDW